MCMCLTRDGMGGEWCEDWVWAFLIMSRYLYIVLGGYLRILGAPIVQSCCTLWKFASYHVFVYDRYFKSIHACVWLTYLDLSQHHPLL